MPRTMRVLNDSPRATLSSIFDPYFRPFFLVKEENGYSIEPYLCSTKGGRYNAAWSLQLHIYKVKWLTC
jgi:hypothetical protein